MKFPLFFFVALFTLLDLLLASFALAQSSDLPSPPIGPPSDRSGGQELSVGLISSLVKTKMETIVKSTNEYLKANGHRPRLELMAIRVNKPARVATEYTNRPNQWFAKIPMTIGLKVSIPVLSDRQIYIPLDVNISCQDWQTGSGKIKVVAQPGPISVEGGNFLEEVVRLKDYVDGRIKSNLPNLWPISVGSNSELPCGTIGVSPGEPPDYRFGFVAYNKPVKIPRTEGVRAVPSVEVTFLTLKRLSARSLYKPVEEIRLEAYANHTMQQSPVLTMREGDEVNLKFPAFTLKAAAIELLVIIANINQQPHDQPQDSAFDAWRKSMNFSPGLHTLKIAKVEKQSAGPGRPKPVFTRVPAYELTYKVTNTNPGLIR